MPELREIPLADIDEPAVVVRSTMDQDLLQDLAESIATVGLLQPIAVKAVSGRYEIVAGHRRFLAVSSLRRHTITAIVYANDEISAEAAKLAENICRADVTAAEEALFFAQLLEVHKLDEEGLCKLVHRSPDYVGDRLRLLRQDREVFTALLKREINFSVARELNKHPEEPMRRYFLHHAVTSGSAARVVAQWVANDVTLKAGLPQPTPVTEQQQVATPPPDAYHIECALCGGDRDPYNLVNVYIHRWELEKILQLIRQGEMQNA